MTKTIFFFLLSIFSQQVFSQYYIKGRVTDAETQQPLKGASVYINNTTKGAVTNDSGEFELGPFAPGRYEVVASFVGFTSLLYSAEITSKDRRISFALIKKEEMLREVLVLTDETRRHYLELFKKYVIGTSVAAEKCLIKNIEEIQFATGETKDEIIGYTENALQIENPQFGYTIYFDLLDFTYNKKTRGSHFYGYTRFVDWGTDEKTKKKWVRNRRQAYEGSTVHFFRSLVDKQLGKNGFNVYQLIAPRKDNASTNNISSQNGQGLKMATRAIEDSMISIYTDSVYKIYQLNIKDGWRIMYTRSTELKEEILRKEFIPGQPPTGTINGLRLRESPVLVNERGINLTPINVYYDGIWAYERLANMLPEDYEPE